MPATAAGLTAAMPSLSPLEHAFERVHHRLAAHASPIAPETTGFAPTLLLRRPGKTNHPHRFRVASPRRAGDACDRDRDRGAAFLQRTLRHLASGLLADGPVLLQRGARDAEHFLLRLVR